MESTGERIHLYLVVLLQNHLNHMHILFRSDRERPCRSAGVKVKFPSWAFVLAFPSGTVLFSKVHVELTSYRLGLSSDHASPPSHHCITFFVVSNVYNDLTCFLICVLARYPHGDGRILNTGILSVFLICMSHHLYSCLCEPDRGGPRLK